MVPTHDLPLERLRHWAATEPDRIYLTQPFDHGRLRHYSWREAEDQVLRMAAHLHRQNWPPASRIAILGKNSAGWILADLAIWAAGYVSVPLYPLQTAEHVREILRRCNAVACFIGKLDDPAITAGIDANVACIRLPLGSPLSAPQWDEIVLQSAPLASVSERSVGDLATVIYTSGTSGTPKGVLHSFETLTAPALGLRPLVGYGQDDRLVSYLPLAHITERSVGEIAPLIGGAHVFFAESIATFTDDVKRARPTLFAAVPRLWQKFQQSVLEQVPAARLNRLLGTPILGRIVRYRIRGALGLLCARAVFSGGAPLPIEIGLWFGRLGLPIHDGYGMTETGGPTHCNPIGRNVPGSVGTPCEGVAHRIDESSGELQLRCPGATLGYDRDPGGTAALLTQDGWLRTGDRARIDTQGRLYILGRLNDTFKTSKGKYVAPVPIESRLILHPALDACIVLGAERPQPFALAVLNEGFARGLPGAREEIASSLLELLGSINRDLDPHEQLDGIVVTATRWDVANGMLTPSMKVRRARIEAHYWQALNALPRHPGIVQWID